MPKPFSPVEFLAYRGQFTNQHGVSMLLLEDNAIHISCPYPSFQPHPGISLEIVGIYPNDGALFSELEIKSKIEYNALKPSHLVKKFKQHEMQVCCFVEQGGKCGSLLFQKTREGFSVIDEGPGTSHVATRMLRSGKDFIAYTAKYFNIEIPRSF